MNVEQSVWLDADDEYIEAEAQRVFANGDRVTIKFPQLHLVLEMTHRQAKAFAEEVMNAVTGITPIADPYAGDKTKGDAFAALRRADK